MKKSKIIIPALAMLVMSTAATVTGTVAWFTMNTTAKAEGMVVSAKTSGSLIIKEADLSNLALPTQADKSTKVTFNSTAHAFYPSTHDLRASPTSGLKYVSNGQNVNFETGTRMNGIDTQTDDPSTADVNEAVTGTELTFEPVGAADSNYFFDYAVYLAGDGMTMSNKTLSISIDNAAELNANGALSIDFYGQEVTSAEMPVPATSGAYLGTLNLAKKVNVGDDGNDDLAELTKSGVTIRNSKTGVADHGAYAIRMRVYYDGALIQNGVTGNTHAVYTQVQSGDPFNANILYYSDINGTSIVPATSSNHVGLYVVDLDASTVCFARSIKYAEIAQQTINVTFSC